MAASREGEGEEGGCHQRSEVVETGASLGALDIELERTEHSLDGKSPWLVLA